LFRDGRLRAAHEVREIDVVEEEELERGAVEDAEARIVHRAELAIEPRGLAAPVAEEQAREGAIEARRRLVARPRLLRGPRVGEPRVALQVLVDEVPPSGEKQH